MQKVRGILGYFSNVPIKLSLLALIIFVFNLLVLCFIDVFINFNMWVPLAIVSIPFAWVVVYGIIACFSKEPLNWFTYCRYQRYAPFVLWYKPNPEMNPGIDIKKIQSVAKPGDIILRCYHYYLDSIVFSENSYFTHVGICKGENGIVDKVLHSTGKYGVHETALETFCKCDDVAILRFSLHHNREERQVLEYINQQDTNDEITKQEQTIYGALQTKVKQDVTNLSVQRDKTFLEYSNQVVLERAQSLIGTPYDFGFNFHDFTRMSCVEYVWYCYKSLYPLHRIKVENFEFFDWIKMRVIIPDVFIKNDFFNYQYCSIPGVTNKAGLIKVMDSRPRKFLQLLKGLFIWNILLLALWYVYFYYTRK